MCSATHTNSAFENSGPVALRDLWLRFHEKELCQDLDAVFNFYPKGMEVWCLVEDERGYQRFSDMIAPLKSSFEIAVYATRPAAEKKPDDEKEPPPSLWNNTELQSSLEITSRDLLSPGQGGRSELSELTRQSFAKQRLIMWAAQMLGWRKKVQRYAADLPELARLGFGAGAAKEMRSHALAVCLSHAQALDKNLAHIMEGMAQALPKPEKGTRRPSEAAKPRMPSSPVDLAAQASAESLSLARRVYRFIYPQEHTVGVSDLKDPALLESLRELRKMLTELQRFAGGARQALP
jgi:hypothetical protein